MWYVIIDTKRKKDFFDTSFDNFSDAEAYARKESLSPDNWDRKYRIVKSTDYLKNSKTKNKTMAKKSKKSFEAKSRGSVVLVPFTFVAGSGKNKGKKFTVGKAFRSNAAKNKAVAALKATSKSFVGAGKSTRWKQVKKRG